MKHGRTTPKNLSGEKAERRIQNLVAVNCFERSSDYLFPITELELEGTYLE
jgi:hypothetical protein